jgi:hypothetical protein
MSVYHHPEIMSYNVGNKMTQYSAPDRKNMVGVFVYLLFKIKKKFLCVCVCIWRLPHTQHNFTSVVWVLESATDTLWLSDRVYTRLPHGGGNFLLKKPPNACKYV